MSKFFLTTPIYYVNAAPHIGHAYTTVASDVLARYHRMLGDDVFFLTGVDEHGAKVAESAAAEGKSPQQFVDDVAAQFQAAWRLLNITNDYFIRTTDPRHERAVQKFMQTLFDKGYLYKSTYEGLYCVGCERFYTGEDLVDGCCPDHRTVPQPYREDNYFFALSKFAEQISALVESDRIYVRPLTRKNEVLGKIRVGLQDVSFSRAQLTWGIPLPFDPSQTTYVWVDALLNYITAIGYGDDPATLARYWPAEQQLMAKDILWFHSIIWPAMLLAAGLEPPKRVFAHGYFTIDGQKMSKTLGNVIDPATLVGEFGVDATRYLLLSEFPFGTDGDIAVGHFRERYNAELANDLGNLLNRSVSMMNRYYEGVAPEPGEATDNDRDLRETAADAVRLVDETLAELQFHETLKAIWSLVNRANRYVEESGPWTLTKSDRARLATVMYNLAESLRLVAQLVAPFMPETAEKMAAQLGIALESGNWAGTSAWGGLRPGTHLGKPVPTFPRLERPTGVD